MPVKKRTFGIDSNMDIDISQIHPEDLSEIAKEIGRSVTAAKLI